MKKLLVMAAMALSSAGAFAQYSGGDFTIQPKIGLNSSNISHSNGDYKAGLAVGAEAEYHTNRWFGISAGLLYSQQGAKNSTTGVKTNMDYLNIPVLANFYVAKGLALKVGLQPGFLLSAKTGDFDYKNECESFDMSLPIGISYEYKGFCLDARCNAGITDTFKGETRKDEDRSRNEVFQLTFGYKFRL